MIRYTNYRPLEVNKEGNYFWYIASSSYSINESAVTSTIIFNCKYAYFDTLLNTTTTLITTNVRVVFPEIFVYDIVFTDDHVARIQAALNAELNDAYIEYTHKNLLDVKVEDLVNSI